MNRKLFVAVAAGLLAPRLLVEAPAGQTIDFLPADFNASPSGLTSRLLPPVASLVPDMGTTSFTSVGGILTANGATATLTTGGAVDADARACTFLWQAVESPN